MKKLKVPETESELKKETEKMLKKLEQEIKHTKPTDRLDSKAIKEAMENVHAYISDCKHFQQKNSLIHAFEAIVYAWGILDTLQRCHLIIKKTDI